MSASIIKSYAQAVFEIAHNEHKTEFLSNDAQTVKKLIEDSEEFAGFLSNPTLPESKREQILTLCLDNKIGQLFMTFILYLNKQNRLAHLPGICMKISQLYLISMNTIPVTVTTKSALPKEQYDLLRKQLEEKFQHKVQMLFNTEPNLLGGMRIQKGNTIFDYSFRHQLERFSKNLITA